MITYKSYAHRRERISIKNEEEKNQNLIVTSTGQSFFKSNKN
jgi:hypothetical protein